MFLIYGSVGIFLITVLIAYAYLKKPAYGISLAITSVILISLAISWNLTESLRSSSAAEKIPLQLLSLSHQSLQPAYGNRYLYKAKLENQSATNQLNSINLQLTLTEEKLTQWVKIWLQAKQSQSIDVYFTSSQLAKPVTKEQWKIEVISSKAR